MTKRVDNERAKRRRQRAAKKYQPDEVDLLLVAEAPPSALERYFYFEDVREKDDLFRYVCRTVLKEEPTREGKAEALGRLTARGVFLIDLQPDPRDSTPLDSFAPALVRRCRRLKPDRIILIKTTVFDAAFTTLDEAGLPVVPVRVPFPGSGQQTRFLAAMARALKWRPKR